MAFIVRTYVLATYSRRRGVWTEYKLWYFGIAMFLISTLALRTPFSSPTRTVHHSRNFTERLGGFLACAAVFITFRIRRFLFYSSKSGFALIGETLKVRTTTTKIAKHMSSVSNGQSEWAKKGVLKASVDMRNISDSKVPEFILRPNSPVFVRCFARTYVL